jgi:hypothetical protein
MRACSCPTCTLNCPRQVSHLTLARGGPRPGSVNGCSINQPTITRSRALSRPREALGGGLKLPIFQYVVVSAGVECPHSCPNTRIDLHTQLRAFARAAGTLVPRQLGSSLGPIGARPISRYRYPWPIPQEPPFPAGRCDGRRLLRLQSRHAARIYAGFVRRMGDHVPVPCLRCRDDADR